MMSESVLVALVAGVPAVWAAWMTGRASKNTAKLEARARSQELEAKLRNDERSSSLAAYRGVVEALQSEFERMSESQTAMRERVDAMEEELSQLKKKLLQARELAWALQEDLGAAIEYIRLARSQERVPPLPDASQRLELLLNQENDRGGEGWL